MQFIKASELGPSMKSSGERYKRLRESGQSLVGTGADDRTSKKASVKSEVTIDNSAKVNSLLETIGKFDANTQKADDLKEINGVGPKMEEALNSIGIYTFLQVSKMTKKEYDLIDEITGLFPGRGERDDWSGQAKKLIN